MNARIPSLDGLRCLSVIFVLIAHFTYSHGSPIQYNQLFDYYAHYGVLLFFSISGYLITTLLIREQKKNGAINIRQFFIRRAFRILPIAYAYLIVVAVLYHRSLTHKELAIASVYLSSYSLRVPWVLNHLWSLSVEEQFYLLWPFVMVAGFVKAKQLAIGAVIVAPLFRIALYFSGHSLGQLYYFPAVSDSLATGCLLALFQPELAKYQSFFTGKYFPLIWAFTLSVPGLNWLVTPNILHLFPSIFNISVGLCIQNAVLTRPRILNTPIVVWVGTLSYGLYIWQMPFCDPGIHSWVTTFPQNLLFAFMAAVVSFYAIEQPILNLRLRLYGNPQPPLRSIIHFH